MQVEMTPTELGIATEAVRRYYNLRDGALKRSLKRNNRKPSEVVMELATIKRTHEKLGEASKEAVKDML